MIRDSMREKRERREYVILEIYESKNNANYAQRCALVVGNGHG